jgi:adenine deaminase
MKDVSRASLIDVAMGRSPADFVIKGGILVNVHTAEVYQSDVAVKGNRIAFVGDGQHTIGNETKVIDANGKCLLPGFIDTHVHSSESGLRIDEYARAVMPHGTTAIVNDSYGPGLFAGTKAIRFEIEAAKKTPLKVFFSTPVGTGYYQADPFSNNETLREKEQAEMLNWPEAHGINEIFPEKVAEKDRTLLKIVEMATKKGKIIYGHGAQLRGDVVQAWLAGVGRIVDHEVATVDEAIEKVRLGIRIAVRESGYHSNVDLVKAIVDRKVDSRYFMFSTDVGPPLMFKKEGGIDNNIRIAVGYGLNPMTAVQMATINAAEYMRMDHEIGSIAPGKIADIVFVNDLDEFKVSMVIASGQIVATDGRFVAQIKRIEYPRYFYNTVKLKKMPSPEDFQIKAPRRNDSVTVRVIGIIPGSSIAVEKQKVLRVKNGLLMSDIEDDIVKIVVFERYRGTGEIGRGFVQGFRMERGAVGSTYMCQQQDLFVIGTNDNDMAIAAAELVKTGGGFIAVEGGKVLAKLELPLSGLMADEPFERTCEKLEQLSSAANSLGSFGPYPFNRISAPVIPPGGAGFGNIKIGRKGLMVKWKMVPLIVD